LTNELLNIKSGTTITILSLSFLHQTKNEEDIASRRTVQDFCSKNCQEAAQISPRGFALFIKKKEAQALTARFLIPKEDEEPLEQGHSHVAVVQIETTAPNTPHLSRTL